MRTESLKKCVYLEDNKLEADMVLEDTQRQEGEEEGTPVTMEDSQLEGRNPWEDMLTVEEEEGMLRREMVQCTLGMAGKELGAPVDVVVGPGSCRLMVLHNLVLVLELTLPSIAAQYQTLVDQLFGSNAKYSSSWHSTNVSKYGTDRVRVRHITLVALE